LALEMQTPSLALGDGVSSNKPRVYFMKEKISQQEEFLLKLFQSP
jgi:hypothetical protein